VKKGSGVFHWFKDKFTGGKKDRLCSYLERHDFFADRGESSNYGKFPRLPYSLTDVLSDRLFRCNNVNAFVCRHGSSAHWLFNNGINVVLGRASRGKSAAAEITYLPNWRDYSGKELDLLLLDSHQMMEVGLFLLPRISERGIIIVSHLGVKSSAMNTENLRAFDDLRNKLQANGWKVLRFANPAPGIGELCADLWYRSGNLLGI